MSAATIKTDDLPLPIFSWFSLSGHQSKLVGQGGISFRNGYPAAAFQQLIERFSLPAYSGWHW
ncbi:TPA: hypothetical protein SGO12_004885 [Escherichia coli]|uniref:hypothetical protein n=1 Tax=Escherichia coli TaxID=562 RepID=UPI0003916A54|nr:hypothetical protein [Escherichia coli]EQW80461.1 hypothetical protein G913_04514 [Escherichia coli UMEA 3124-1]EFF5668589.1 hypothetical protein [Escherichia coli]EGO4109421.1 hypothetical protein [Escherichia coli]EKR6313837.1 hypothetical protein [Escherichia coli]MBY3013423.1 hypothetical protein [Escherichia coli]